jgi:hypothetical protein
LPVRAIVNAGAAARRRDAIYRPVDPPDGIEAMDGVAEQKAPPERGVIGKGLPTSGEDIDRSAAVVVAVVRRGRGGCGARLRIRSEEHTSELQSL